MHVLCSYIDTIVSTIRDINCGEIAFSYFKSDTSTLLDPPPPESMLDQKMCLGNIDVGGKGVIY